MPTSPRRFGNPVDQWAAEYEAQLDAMAEMGAERARAISLFMPDTSAVEARTAELERRYAELRERFTRALHI
jgi:hypothetical protein